MFLAWLILFITAVVWQVRVYIVYYIWNISDGSVQEPPSDLFEKVGKQIHQGIAMNVLNPVSLWCVKFAFLVMFQKLGNNVKGQRTLWWVVFAVTVATLIITIGALPWACAVGNVIELSGDDLVHVGRHQC